MTDSEYNDLLENLDGIIQGRLNVYACFTIYFNIFTDVSLLLHTYVCIISYYRLLYHYFNPHLYVLFHT